MLRQHTIKHNFHRIWSMSFNSINNVSPRNIWKRSGRVACHFRQQRMLCHMPWWRHQMETFSALLAICHRSPVNSPHKGQWRGALVFSLICAWINGWVNKRWAGDLRHHHTHYDVTVIYTCLATNMALKSWREWNKMRTNFDSLFCD